MPNELMKLIAKGEGHCCVYSLFRSYKLIGQNNLSGLEARRLAEKIGVVSRTIYNWNKRIRERTCICEQKPFCANQRLNSSRSKE